ncbi:MAG TPA: penicillin-binding protein activator [Gammaproteobacteria bacterium]|nr:penicillin-binding protein activator [Gammaproteobacteria bacterium]
MRYPAVFGFILCLAFLGGCKTNFRHSPLKGVQDQYTLSNRVAGNPHIALLLPTQGPHANAAKIVRDGFLAAYYRAKQNQLSPVVEVKMVDTSNQSITEAYQKALSEQATLIVGPLTKPEVQAIAKLPLDIPVLALNTISEDNVSQPNLYQFGLMPEDEVIAIGEHALRQGHQRSLILVPHSEWGLRLADTFKHFWNSHHATVVDIKLFKSPAELESKIRDLLQVKGTTRRTDADMIFIAASHELALQIKPLLNFYYAETLPVYATSSIYSGTPSPHKDQDLNGVHFCDMPWVLQSSEMQETHTALQELWPNSMNASPRFFALGMDAYQLAIQLGNAERFSARSTPGFTGELQINNTQRIQRGLVCARFEQGIPVLE